MMHAVAPPRHHATPDTPLGERPNTGRVLLPVELLTADLTATALAVWVILAEHVRPGRPARVTRETLMRRLGRDGAGPRTVSRAVSELEAAGWLKVTRIRARSRSVNLYQPLGTIGPDDSRRWVELTAAHRAALQINATFTPHRLRTLARWLYLGGREGWTRDTLADYAERFGTSTDTAKRDRAALVAAGYLETRSERWQPTITAAPGRLPAARSDASQPLPPPGGISGSPRGAEVAALGGHEWHTEVTPVEVTPVEVTARGPARRARLGSSARVAATTTPPAPRAETITEQNPEPVDQLDGPHDRDKHDSTQHLAAAGVVLANLPHGYQQQQDRYRRGTLHRIARALAAGYGPAAVVLAAQRHDQPEHNPTHTLELALRGLAADVLAGDACPECGHDPDGTRPICDRCNPDRDTLTAAELAAVAALRARLDAEELPA